MGHTEPLNDKHISSGHSNSGNSSALGRASSSSSSSASSSSSSSSSGGDAKVLVAPTEGQVTALLEYGSWLVTSRRLDLVVAFIRALRHSISIISSKSSQLSLPHVDLTVLNDATRDDAINSNVTTSNHTNGANHTDHDSEQNAYAAAINWWQETGKFLEHQIQEKVMHEYGMMVEVD